MFPRMLFANAIRVPKALTTVAVSLRLLPGGVAGARPAAGSVSYCVRSGVRFVIIVGLVLVLLAAIGAMVIFVWLVRWATRGYPVYDQGVRRSHAGLDILEERFARGRD